MTTRDDTLWQIATRTKASQEVTTNQQMLAIQRLNRQAFIRDNINLLKAGYVLDIPTESEALSMSRDEANFIVANQISQWRNREITPLVAQPDVTDEPLRSQIDATAEDEPAAGQDTPAEGDVRIVAATGETGGRTAAGNRAEVNELIEERESLNRQVDELAYQLDREKDLAASEIEVKDRQLEVANQEIAELQAQLAAMREQLDQAAQNRPPPSAPPAGAWWQTPLFLYGIIALLVIVTAVLLLALRRSRSDEVDVYEESEVADEPAEEYAAAVQPIEPALTTEPEPEAEADVAPIVAQDEEEVAEAETTDVIGEAEIYIAYGRYDQAANLLLGVLNDEPGRHEVRLKLLEVFVETGDSAHFSEHAEYIDEHCEDEDILLARRELETQIVEGQQTDEPEAEAPADDFDDSPAEEAETEAEAEIEAQDETGDDDILDLGDADTGTPEDETTEEEFELEFDDLDLDDIPAAEGVNQAADDLGGDLGLDFDPEKDVDETSGETGETDDADVAAAESPVNDEPSADDELAGDLDELLEGLDLEEDDAAEGDGADAEDFEFDDGDGDINSTKLDLAEAYIDMGDVDGARDILNEVVQDGTADQQSKAQDMLNNIQ